MFCQVFWSAFSHEEDGVQEGEVLRDRAGGQGASAYSS